MHSSNYKRTKPEYRGNWKTVRARILKRDNYECQIGLPGCTLQAGTVDHIVPLAWGGDPRDESNLRAACVHCNAQLAAVAKKYKPRSATTRQRTTTIATSPTITPTSSSRDW